MTEQKMIKEAFKSILKTLEFRGDDISLSTAITLADVRIRRLKGELSDWQSLCAEFLLSVEHESKSGKCSRNCVRCKLEEKIVNTPRWRKILNKPVEEKNDEIRRNMIWNQ